MLVFLGIGSHTVSPGQSRTARRSMRWSHLLGVSLTLGVAGVSAAWAQTPSVTSTPNGEVSQIRAAGTAKRGLRADLATITVQFSATGPTPKAAGRLVALK